MARLEPDPRHQGGAHILVEGLHKTYEHGGRLLRVLRGIDLEIHPGELVSVVGASGAGKSTLLHILGTLDAPTQGRICFNGQDLSRLPPARLAAFRNQAIGFVFQFHHLLPEFTALENTMMPALIARLPTGQSRKDAQAILERLGLGERLDHRPSELSGGEQQRVALARSLIRNPKLLLADEPTGNLDSKAGQDIHQLLLEASRERSMTVLVVTHNRELAQMAPRRLAMIDGQIVQADPAAAPAHRPSLA